MDTSSSELHRHINIVSASGVFILSVCINRERDKHRRDIFFSNPQLNIPSSNLLHIHCCGWEMRGLSRQRRSDRLATNAIFGGGLSRFDIASAKPTFAKLIV